MNKRNSNNIKLILIFWIGLICSIYPHEEFYRLETNKQLVTVNSAPYIKWGVSNINLNKMFYSANVPAELDYEQVILKFESAVSEWDQVSCYSFSYSGAGLNCAFVYDEQWFPNPDTPGRIKYAIITQQTIVYSTNNPNSPSSQTELMLNATFNRNFRWTTADVFVFTNEVHFKSIIRHEIGHLLGLAHCTDISAIMYYVINPLDIKTITALDIQGMNTICGITGLEDNIVL